MKCLIVFDSLNDISFCSADNEFHLCLRKQAIETGLCSESESIQAVDTNVLMQLYSPIISSQRFMINQTKNEYHRIECENGLAFQFKQLESQILLAICKGKGSDEFSLSRELQILVSLIQFQFGPVPEQIRPSNVAKREEIWKRISIQMETWRKLKSEEQSFLVEAYEKLVVSPSVNAKCINLLENSLVKLKDAGEKHPLHALLLVGTKELAFYSSRNVQELQPSEVLLSILMTQSLYPSVRLSDAPVVTTINGGDQNDSESEEEYFSAGTDADDQNSDTESVGVLGFQSNSSRSSSFSRDSSDDLLNTPDENLPAQSINAFLETPSCKYTPHQLHCVCVLPGISLVIVSKLTQSQLASLITRALNRINDIMSLDESGSLPSGRYLYENLDTAMSQLLDGLKKLKHGPEKLIQELASKWDAVKKCNLLQWLETSKGQGYIPPQLESNMDGLCDRLKILFTRLYVNSRTRTPEVQAKVDATLKAIQENLRKQIKDFSDYLIVKVQRNITMTSYLEQYPGMIHFIFIDRNSCKLISPSINVLPASETNKGDITLVIKQKIWEMVTWAQSNLVKGNISQLKREQDYAFSYSTWFEDNHGSCLSIQNAFNGTEITKLPGIIGGNFYRLLAAHCVPSVPPQNIRCYELMCLHIGILPSDVIMNQSRQLAGHLVQSIVGVGDALSLVE